MLKPVNEKRKKEKKKKKEREKGYLQSVDFPSEQHVLCSTIRLNFLQDALFNNLRKTYFRIINLGI